MSRNRELSIAEVPFRQIYEGNRASRRCPIPSGLAISVAGGIWELPRRRGRGSADADPHVDLIVKEIRYGRVVDH